MKTRWGTCNIEAERVWLNLELAKKPVHCLEYIVVHELMHLLERHHNERFVGLMNGFMPTWRFYREELNREPLGHEEWDTKRLIPAMWRSSFNLLSSICIISNVYWAASIEFLHRNFFFCENSHLWI